MVTRGLGMLLNNVNAKTTGAKSTLHFRLEYLIPFLNFYFPISYCWYRNVVLIMSYVVFLQS